MSTPPWGTHGCTLPVEGCICPGCGLDAAVPHSPFTSRLPSPRASLGFLWLPTMVSAVAKKVRVRGSRIHFAVLVSGLHLITC